MTAGDLRRIDEFTEQYRAIFRQAAIGRGQFIFAGSHLERHGEQYFNVAHVFTPDGKELIHKKTHLFPAEREWRSDEGDEFEVWQIGPAKVGVAVCYEAEIPEVARILAVQGAEVILCPSFTFTEFGSGGSGIAHRRGRSRTRSTSFTAALSATGVPRCPTHTVEVRSSAHAIRRGLQAESSPKPRPTNRWSLPARSRPRISMRTVKRGRPPTFRDRDRRADLYRKFEPYSRF